MVIYSQAMLLLNTQKVDLVPRAFLTFTA